MSRIDMTICWRCDTSYAIEKAARPTCDAANANVDLDAAAAQAGLSKSESERAP